MTSSEDDNILYDLLQKKRWDEAASRVNTEEGMEDLRRKNEYDQLPLHEACVCGAPFELVEAMLEGYEEAVRVTDDQDRLPLHEACCRRHISPRVVRLILDAYPEGAKFTVKSGWLPLHYAAFRNAPSEVLMMLIEAHPEGVTTPNNAGDLPLHLLATVNYIGQLPLHNLAKYASPDKEEDMEKVELLFRPLLDDEDACLVPSSRPWLGETPLDIGAKLDLLNLLTCLRIPRCPAKIIVTVAKRHPEQLREMGEDGCLPLHIAAANPVLNGEQVGQENLIVKLVRLYPDAAAISDGEGRSPLNLAIESGKGWKEGVEAIADAAKGVRTIRDVGTNLFPFMLAASVENPCITTVYELLRCCPDMCKKP